MKNTYWHSNGKYQTQYQNLYNDLVPDCDKADTLHGELLRAICKVYYDYYNNGMCNNTSGPVLFITKHANLDEKNQEHIGKVYQWCNTGGYIPDSVSLEIELESIADYIIESIMNGINSDNEIDMYDYQEDDFYEEEYDEYDDEEDYE